MIDGSGRYDLGGDVRVFSAAPLSAPSPATQRSERVGSRPGVLADTLLTLLLPLLLASLAGCEGTIDSFRSSIGGVEVREHQTRNLLCATAQFADRISVSCIARPAPTREAER